MTRRSTRLIASLLTVALLGTGAVALLADGTSPALAAGNRQCQPIITTPAPPPFPTPPPATTPPPTVTYPARCVLPYLPGWRPQVGVVFNNPLGTKAAAQAIVRRVVAAVKHTPRGSTIRIAVYSFDRAEVAYWLRKARKRGVHIQIVVNDKVMSGVARKLQRVLGKDPKKASFLVSCKGSCRAKGSGGNLHDKVYSFSQTGGARDLIIVSSGNLTSKAVYRQWNDSFGISQDTGFFDAWVQMFTQIKNRQQVGPRVIGYSSASGSFGTLLSRTSSRYQPSTDAVLRRLQKVTCLAPSGYGLNGRTVIRITMYAMFKTRGEAIARELARLKKAGCNIAMILSVPGGKTSRILGAAGIPMRNADWQFNERDPLIEDGIGGYGPSFYSHFKVMALSGTYDGVATNTVWTGSENWDALSMANEEIVLQVNAASAYRAYLRQFSAMWSGRATHRMGIEPLGGP